MFANARLALKKSKKQRHFQMPLAALLKIRFTKGLKRSFLRLEAKILTLLGFASKAGKLSYGAASSADAIKCKKSKLIIISSDISEKSQKEMRFLSDKYSVEHILLNTVDTTKLSNAVGRNCGILSVNDSSFASAISEEYGRKC